MAVCGFEKSCRPLDLVNYSLVWYFVTNLSLLNKERTEKFSIYYFCELFSPYCNIGQNVLGTLFYYVLGDNIGLKKQLTAINYLISECNQRIDQLLRPLKNSQSPSPSSSKLPSMFSGTLKLSSQLDSSFSLCTCNWSFSMLLKNNEGRFERYRRIWCMKQLLATT